MSSKSDACRIVISILLMAALLLCSGCEAAEKRMIGRYQASTAIIEGWRMSPADVGAEMSSITVNGIDNNAISTLDFYLSGENSLLTGYISEGRNDNSKIWYTFHVISVYGDLLSGTGRTVYLLYYP